MDWLAQMHWFEVQVPAAIISGVFTIVVAFVTYLTTPPSRGKTRGCGY